MHNTQINAIIEQVERVEQPKLTAQFKKELHDTKKRMAPIAKKYYSAFQQLPAELRKFLSPYDKVSEEKILDYLVKVDKKYFDTKELRSKIIIASIDSGDIEDLKKKLNISF